MKLRIAALAIAGIASVWFFGTYAQAQDATKNATDGVYAQAQADAGKSLYSSKCASCHGDALTGGEMAPALAGGSFMSNWNGLTAFDLFDRIRKTMPLGKEGSLGRGDVAQIVAFILSSNGYPAGSTALDTHDEVLKTIKLDSKK